MVASLPPVPGLEVSAVVGVSGCPCGGLEPDTLCDGRPSLRPDEGHAVRWNRSDRSGAMTVPAIPETPGEPAAVPVAAAPVRLLIPMATTVTPGAYRVIAPISSK
jgi:hypothetical protein